jgi:hypothetical protein
MDIASTGYATGKPNLETLRLQIFKRHEDLDEARWSGLSARTLNHSKWFLSSVYQHAVASGIVFANPVPNAKWLCRGSRRQASGVFAR